MKFKVTVLVLAFVAAVSRADPDEGRSFLLGLDGMRWPSFSERFSQWTDEAIRAMKNVEQHASRATGMLGQLMNGAKEQAENTFRQVQNKINRALSDQPEWEGGNDDTGEKETFNPSVVIVDKPTNPEVGESFWDSLETPGIGNFFFNFQRPTPWWKGSNICVERKEIDESQNQNEREHSVDHNRTFGISYLHATQCKETETSYICTTRMRSNDVDKTYIVKRQCCHGFKKREDGKPGCLEIDLKGLAQTMKDLGGNKFVDLATSVGLLVKMNNGNFTVFCPTNEAVLDFEDENENNEIPQGRIVRSADIATVLAGHLTEGYLRSGDLMDEQVLPSINGQSGIRVNKYYTNEKVMTANCARVIGTNNYAKNGVVHLVDKMLPVPTKTVADIISSDPQFSILKGMMSQAGLVQTLRDPKGNFTVFAPSDSAFLKLDANLRQKLQEGSSCVISVLKSHVLPHVVCSAAVSGQAHVINMLGNALSFTRDENEKLYVNQNQIVARDIMGTNGVVHIIEDVLFPPQAQQISQALHKSDMTDLLDLMEDAGIIQTMDSMQNITFFAPSKDAIKKLPHETLQELRADPKKLKEILMHHVINSRVPSCDMHNNQQLETVSGDTIRINLYGYIPGLIEHATAQCAAIISRDNNICDGIVHVVDRLLLPPKQNIIDALEEMEGFTVLQQLLKITGLEEHLKQETGPFTLLAPSDEVFNSTINGLSASELLKNKQKAEKILKLHILPEMLCCRGITHTPLFTRQQVRTLEGSPILMHRSMYGHVRFGHARATQCDVVAENGVIHVINKVLHPPRPRSWSFGASDPFFTILI